jgi:hypothetical protein
MPGLLLTAMSYVRLRQEQDAAAAPINRELAALNPPPCAKG